MHYNETNQLMIENAMPRATYNATKYFEFTIDEKNTYTEKDIIYDIVLNHGNNHETRTERIKDKLLKFTLVEIKDGVETTVVNSKSYSDLTNKRIWVNTISKNTNDQINITYRLYMWISGNTKIGNTSDADYDMETWNKEVFASIKVNVTGDFNEKELSNETDASCFTTTESITYTHNTNMTEEELNKCVTIFRDEWNYGLGEDEGETFEAFCQGTGTLFGDTFQQNLNNDNFENGELKYLEQNNIIKEKMEGLVITDYDSSCGSDIVIPKTINGNHVTIIGDYSFEEKNLTSVILPDSISKIESWSFYNNHLTNIVIPDGVRIISLRSFENNNITTVTIPDNVTYLSCYAFDDEVEIIKNDSLECYQEK